MSDPYAANVSLLVPFDYSTAIPQDYSPNKKELNLMGAVVPSAQNSKFYGTSALFDGATGYIDVPPSTDFDFGTGDYTVEFWVNLMANTAPSVSDVYPRLINSRLTANGANGFQVWVRRATGTGAYPPPYWVLDHASGNGSSVITGTNTSLNDGQWHHVAFCRAGVDSACYLDGQLKSVGTDPVSYTRGGTEGIRIGARGGTVPATYTHVSAFLQDLRITKGVCRYTGNFTPPDRFLSDTNLSGTVLTTEGLPKSGMTVRCIDRNPKIQRMWTTNTDKFGHYSFLLPKGDYTILAQDDNGNLNDQVKRVRN